MSDRNYHLFFSYSRKDNEPRNSSGVGWITVFARRLGERYRELTGFELSIFFDEDSIEPGRDWKRELRAGIRASRLLLAFLSENYESSENCRWEWTEYLSGEHTQARGDDGITPLFLLPPNDLASDPEDPELAWRGDLNRRHRDSNSEFQGWFEADQDAMQSAEFEAQLDELCRRIAYRLDRVRLAAFSDDIGNLPGGYEHFVGRHPELRELYTILSARGEEAGRGSGGRGMIAAAHSPGGLGKTALARQFGYAYGERYAAGGAWEVACEGKETLGAALIEFADAPAFRRFGASLGIRFELTEAQRAHDDLAAEAVFEFLREVGERRLDAVAASLNASEAMHSRLGARPEASQARSLLILDNVDQPELLSSTQFALLPTGTWLEVLVTTRLDPDEFAVGDRWRQALPIDPLPDEDALTLIRDFQPGRRFADAEEEAAARTIVHELGGYTLAVELVAAYLGGHAAEGVTPTGYLARLREEGVVQVDAHAEERSVADRVRHAEKKVGTLVDWAWERLSEPARTALHTASLMRPDLIPLSWLRSLTHDRHAEEMRERQGYPKPWNSAWRELRGLRLLQPQGKGGAGLPAGDLPEVVRIHRLVAQHVAQRPGTEQLARDLDELIRALSEAFDYGVGMGGDASLRAQHRWLRDQSSYLLEVEVTTARFRTCGVAALHEAAHGSLIVGIELTKRVLESIETFYRAASKSPEALRDISVASGSLAHLLVRRGRAGDIEQALAHYERSLGISEELMDADPDSSHVARDVSVGLNNLGMLLQRRGQAGDAKRALQSFERSLAIAEGLWERSPESAEAARDVSVSLSHLANALLSRGGAGDAEQALGHLERGLALAERMLAANPGSTLIADQLAVLLCELAACLSSRGQAGDEERALLHLKRSASLMQSVLAAHPSSLQAKRSLSACLQRLGDHLLQRGRPGDMEQAFEHTQRSASLNQELMRANPESAEAARDTLTSLSQLAGLLLRRGQAGDLEQALACGTQSLRIAEALFTASPQSALAARDVMSVLERVSRIHAAMNTPESSVEAIKSQAGSLELARSLADANPGSWEHVRAAAWAAFLTSERAMAIQRKDLAGVGLAECHQRLAAARDAGMEIDRESARLLAQLDQVIPPS